MTYRYYVILGDIHGNYQALCAVDQDIQSIRKIFPNLKIISLGDVVGYGSRPNECMAWVTQHCSLCILGNHDREMIRSMNLDPEIKEDFWPITYWTRVRLESRHKDTIREWKNLQINPEGLHGCTLFHSDLQNKDHYIRNFINAGGAVKGLATPVGIGSHTHFQAKFVSYTSSLEAHTHAFYPVAALPNKKSFGNFHFTGIATDLHNDWQSLKETEKTILNCGSVGQPRYYSILEAEKIQHDPRASYLLLRLNGNGAGEYQFRRVPYDIQAAQNDYDGQVRSEDLKEHNILRDGISVSESAQTKRLEEMAKKLPDLVVKLKEILRTGKIPRGDAR